MIAQRPTATPGLPSLSELGLTVDTSSAGVDPETAVALLRRARSLGVTTYDLGGVPRPELAEAILSRAFPQGDPRIVVIVRPEEDRQARGEPTVVRRTSSQAPRGMRETTSLFRRLFEVRPARALAEPEEEYAPVRRAGSADGPWLLRCETPEEVASASLRQSPVLASVPGSLLRQELLPKLPSTKGPGRVDWIVRDPLAGGSLDGRRFRGTPIRPGAASPRTVREMAGALEEVAAFAFLTLPKRRTLAQAAIRYVLDRPGVVSTCVPLPPVERWEELLGYAAAPALTETERTRAESLGTQREGRSSSGPLNW